MTYPVPAPLPEAPLSVNFRVSEAPDSPQFTLRASNANELEHLAADAAQHGAAIGRYLVEFRAGLLAGVGVQAPQAPTQAAAHAAPAAQPAYAPSAAPAAHQAVPQHATHAAPQTGANGPAPTCPHGTKVYRSGTKNGRPWAMWACPTPKDTPGQCPPEWV